MSEEIATAAADLALVEQLRRRLGMASADSGALWIALEMALQLCNVPERNQDEAWQAKYDLAASALKLEHPGAQLLTELEAARVFIATARLIGIDWDAKPEERERWLRDLHAYDEATKVRSE